MTFIKCDNWHAFESNFCCLKSIVLRESEGQSSNHVSIGAVYVPTVHFYFVSYNVRLVKDFVRSVCQEEQLSVQIELYFANVCPELSSFCDFTVSCRVLVLW